MKIKNKIFFYLLLKLLLLNIFAFGQTTYIPEDIQIFYNQGVMKSSFEFNLSLNPFYLRGDFDGDKKADYAIQIVDRKTEKTGIIIYHPTKHTHYVIGAGHKLSNRPGDDYNWIEAWEVYYTNQIQFGNGEIKRLKLLNEAILVRKLESSSGIIYWDGKQYRWYQLGD